MIHEGKYALTSHVYMCHGYTPRKANFPGKKWSETFRPVKIDNFCSKLEMFSNHFGGFKLVFSIEGSQNAKLLGKVKQFGIVKEVGVFKESREILSRQFPYP